MLSYDDGPSFPAITNPILTRVWVEREIEADPERGRVEFGSQWASVHNAYLKPEHVHRAFGPWQGRPLAMVLGGALSTRYHAHCDTSRSLANTALVIAHLEDRGERVPDVVIDRIDVWRPKDFPDGQIDYLQIEDELAHYLEAFPIVELTFDGYQSASLVDRLTAFARNLPWRTAISICQPSARTNWEEAEIFKTALAMNKVHSPQHELAERELLFLGWDGRMKVEPPRTGPCTTSDIADGLFAVVRRLIGRHFDPHRALSELRLLGSQPGGFPAPTAHDQAVFDQFSNFRSIRSSRGAPRQRNRVPGDGRPRWRYP